MLSFLASVALVALLFRLCGASAGDLLRRCETLAAEGRPDLRRLADDCARDVSALGRDLLATLDRSQRAGLIWSAPGGWARGVAERTGLTQHRGFGAFSGGRTVPLGPTASGGPVATRRSPGAQASAAIESARARVELAKTAFERARLRALRARRELRR